MAQVWVHRGYLEETCGKTCRFPAPKILYRWRYQFMSQKTCKPMSTCKKITMCGNFYPHFSLQRFHKYLCTSPVMDGGDGLREPDTCRYHLQGPYAMPYTQMFSTI